MIASSRDDNGEFTGSANTTTATDPNQTSPSPKPSQKTRLFSCRKNCNN